VEGSRARTRLRAGHRSRATRWSVLAPAHERAQPRPGSLTECGPRSRAPRTERVVRRHRPMTRAGAAACQVATPLRRRRQGTHGRASAGFKAHCKVATGCLLHVGAARRVRGEKPRHASRARAAARTVRRKHRIEISSCVLGRAVRRHDRARGAELYALETARLAAPGARRRNGHM
jgi:hypothetical protein